MGISKSILGMNARNFLYIRRYNSPFAKNRADDKLETKQLLIKNKLPTPEIIAKFLYPDDIKQFNWQLPADGFVIKPARGYGGGGILVINSWDGENAITASGEILTKKQIQSHLYDIFDGAYSLQFLPDKAFIETLIVPSILFQKIKTTGVPDIRVIVFRKIPIMAMMRVPTNESHGKANLQLGAIGIGIDIRAGITTHGLYKKQKTITHFPESKIKIRGNKIPQWHEILLLASKVADVSQLGYVGIDIVIDQNKGPIILEINSRPGLSIQNANLASLRTRMDRVEDMEISSPERGVEVAQSLFSDESSDLLKSSPITLSVIQPVTVYGANQASKQTVLAKLDSGAYRTSIDKKLAEKLRLSISGKKVFVQSASGTGYRDTCQITFELAGKKIKTTASIADRTRLKFPIIIGRVDLEGFLIRPDFGEYPDEGKEI
jgi:alpha-L-glutamate ligase-like protein